MNFLEDYTLLEEIGQGGFATVYKVRHNRLGYVRAIRVLNSTIAFGEQDPMYQKFLNECRLLLCLGNGNHPNIVHIYQPLLKDSKAIVEMDYIDGNDVGSHVRMNSGFVHASDVIRLLTDISDALAYCHVDIYKYCMDRELDSLQDDPDDGSRLLIDEPTRQRLIEKYRVIHNDIHSGNIIRRENGSYVLLDFGLAIEGDEVVRSSRRKNGAPEFMAPEKWDDGGILTPQTDIYSFGVVLYEYLTGQVPFPIDKSERNMDKAIFFVGEAHKGLMPPSVLEARREAYERLHPGKKYEQDYPDWLEEVMMKCLEKDPAMRYANAKELHEDVMRRMNAASSGVAPAPKPQPEPEPKVIIKTVDNPEHIARIEELTSEVSGLQKQLAETKIKLDSAASASAASRKHRMGYVVVILALMAIACVLGYMWYSEHIELLDANAKVNELLKNVYNKLL